MVLRPTCSLFTSFACSLICYLLTFYLFTFYWLNTGFRSIIDIATVWVDKVTCPLLKFIGEWAATLSRLTWLLTTLDWLIELSISTTQIWSWRSCGSDWPSVASCFSSCARGSDRRSLRRPRCGGARDTASRRPPSRLRWWPTRRLCLPHLPPLVSTEPVESNVYL